MKDLEYINEDVLSKFEETLPSSMDPKNRLAFMAQMSVSRVFIHNNKLLCILGVEFITKRVGQIWLLKNNEFDNCLKEVCKLTRTYLGLLVEQDVFRRLQAVVRAEDKYRKFVEFLGFRYEGTLIAYEEDGSNSEMWGRVLS